MKAMQNLLILPLLLWSLNPSALAQLQFSAPTDYSVGNSPAGLAVGDFNGDGKKDLAVVNTGDQTVSILLGNGDGTFQPAVDYACGGDCNLVAVGDFNADGHLDLAVSNQSANTVSILLGNGDGTFQSAIQYNTITSADYVAIADFNNDKKPDLLVASFSAATISILLGNGNGTFQTPVATSVGSITSFVSVGDFNGDGKLDVAAGNSADKGYATGNLLIMLGNGDGTFQAPLASQLSFVPTFLASGDFNGDGKLDLALTGTSAGRDCFFTCIYDVVGFAAVLLGNGDGTFVVSFKQQISQWNQINGGDTPRGLAVADLDNDGKLDLAVLTQPTGPDACAYSGGIGFYLGTGDGTFQHSSNFLQDLGAFSFAVQDINGDTLPDLIATNIGDSCSAPPPPNTVNIFVNTTPSSTLSLTLAGNGAGNVTSQPPILNCSLSCTGNFAAGTQVTLAATANSTSVFTGWSGACSGTGACSISMNAAESVTATFTALFPLSVALSGNGGGTVTSSPAGINCGSTCTAEFVSGTAVTLAVASNAASNFTGWSGACSGTAACSVTLKAAGSVSASFNLQDFSISPASATLTLQPGGQGTDLTTLEGVNGPFSSAIQLSCAVTGTAPKPSCALSAQSVTPGSGSGTSTLTVTAPSTADMHLPFDPWQRRPPVYALWMPLFVGITLLGGTHKRREKFALFCALLGLLILQIACGGASSTTLNTQPPPTNYTVTVTGTAGGIQHSAKVTVTLQ